MSGTELPAAWRDLADVLDSWTESYAHLGDDAQDLTEYLRRDLLTDDEETLTERILGDIIERVLGFGRNDYVPQLSRSGRKPDFTPSDLVAHRFVLDAKSSRHALPSATSERQIRGYMEQRRLDFGLLFNLREIVVYSRAEPYGTVHLRLRIVELWETARGRRIALDQTEQFTRFVEIFKFRNRTTGDKLGELMAAESWYERLRRDDSVEIDLQYLGERLRRISGDLEGDVALARPLLEERIAYGPDVEDRLRDELVAIAGELEPGIDPAALPIRALAFSSSGPLPERAWAQYVRRVSQLALTRILLHRAWEDVGFVEDVLQNGGLESAYDRLGHDLRAVLDEAFRAGDVRYGALFGRDDRYDWYRPGDEALVDVLYALLPVPLGRLRADVLGGLYESSVDAADRDRLGQFYTPRSAVELMLDRVGFHGADGVFHLRGDGRRPVRLWDFSTGSGGFLVEAAHRITEIAVDGVAADPSMARDGLVAVASGLHGTEISPFPYYLTEINLLLQVSRLLALIIERGGRPDFTLSVVHTDALATRIATRPERGAATDSTPELESDQRFGLEELSPPKRRAWESIRGGDFDVVVGNPPYVSEANNKVLFDRLRALPAWPKADVPGKSDYAYFFLALAVEKLVVGGRMAVVTPAGWTNAGNAEWLRGKLLASMRIDEAFLFGGLRLFTPEHEDLRSAQRHGPPTVESLILIATKVEDPAQIPADHAVRVVLVDDEQAALRDLPVGAGTRDLLQRLAARADGRPGRRHGVLVHDLPHGMLEAGTPWPLKYTTNSVQVRVVRHMDRALATRGREVELLDERWKLFRGIETGADAYSGRVRKRLTAPVRARLDAAGVAEGDPILEVPLDRATTPPWSDHPESLARSHEATAVHYGAIDPAQETRLVWLRHGDTPSPAILHELAVWKPVLAGRAAIVRTQGDTSPREWWETGWPRGRVEMTSPKVIGLYRTDRGRFALDETGRWQPSTKSTLAVSRSRTDSVAYLCGLLNSELLDVWYGIRGKVPWHDRRNYEPKPMARIPYRHVPPLPDWEAGPSVAALRATLVDDGTVADPAGLDDAVTRVGRRLRGAEALNAQAMVEHLVRALVVNRTRLLALRPVADGLTQAVRDPWRAHGVEVRRGAVLATLDDDEWRSLRIGPAVSVDVRTDGRVGRGRIEAAPEGARLVFRHGRRETLTVVGDDHRLAVLIDAIDATSPQTAAEVLALRIPVDPVAFERRVEETSSEIAGLLDDGRRLVESVERVVCRLYDVDESLERAVIAHAVTRSLRGSRAYADAGGGDEEE